MKRIFTAIFLSLIFISCGNDQNKSHKALREYVAQYTGRKLILPADHESNLFGKTYGLNHINADYLVVSYIDSDDCTPCHLKLPYWKELNDKLDTLSTIYATTLLIIRPDTLDKVTEFLSNANYDFPVIVDTVGTWTNQNELPKDKILQSFLIDKSWKILAIGNPVESPAISQLYMRIITGEENKPTVESPLKMVNNKTDLGTIPPDATRELEFLVSNSCKDTISVEKIMTPCECVSVDATDINPYSSGRISIKFDASLTKGAFHYPIIIRYKGIVSPIVIHLYGMVSL